MENAQLSTVERESENGIQLKQLIVSKWETRNVIRMETTWSKLCREFEFYFAVASSWRAKKEEPKMPTQAILIFIFFSENLINWLHKENKRKLTRQYDISLLIFNFAAYGLILEILFHFCAFFSRARSNHVTMFNFEKLQTIQMSMGI